jgi:hypothetical protein
MEKRQVDREYLDEALNRLATDPGYQPKGWSHTEVADFRLLVQCARAAKVVADLRNLRVLRIMPSDATDSSRARATVGSSRVIGLTFKNTNAGYPTVVFELLTSEMDAL